jgi:hypothetical protein
MTDYNKGFRYEMLIRHAFDCPRGMKNGAHNSFLENAISMEKGETYAKQNGSFQKQFDKVKGYTSKALIKLSNKKPFSKEATYFLQLEDRLLEVGNTSQLQNLVDMGMEKVMELRDSPPK